MCFGEVWLCRTLHNLDYIISKFMLVVKTIQSNDSIDLYQVLALFNAMCENESFKSQTECEVWMEI